MRLADFYPGSSHVQFHELADKTDTEIWHFAGANEFCIVTQDADFAEKSRLYGSPPKVIWLRCRNLRTKQVEVLLRACSSAIHEF